MHPEGTLYTAALAGCALGRHFVNGEFVLMKGLAFESIQAKWISTGPSAARILPSRLSTESTGNVFILADAINL